MPIYEYECVTEGRRFEMFQKMSEDPTSKCPSCGGPVKKLVSATAFQLKGGGWYKDGYASGSSIVKEKAKAQKDSPSESAPAVAKGNEASKSKETKTETTKKE